MSSNLTTVVTTVIISVMGLLAIVYGCYLIWEATT